MSALFGKTALVTGAKVLVHYGNSEKEADAVVAEITHV
jgi:hypothetical protein